MIEVECYLRWLLSLNFTVLLRDISNDTTLKSLKNIFIRLAVMSRSTSKVTGVMFEV